MEGKLLNKGAKGIVQSNKYAKNIECTGNTANNNISLNAISNNKNNLMNNNNLEFSNSPDKRFDENSEEINLKLSYDWMKSKYGLVGNSLFSEERIKLFEFENEDFDKIYNDNFCSVKNFEKGNKNISNEEINQKEDFISYKSNPFSRVKVSRYSKNKRLNLFNSKNYYRNNMSNRNYSFKKNGYNCSSHKGINFPNENKYQGNEEKSTEAFNQWYKSFYNFDEKNCANFTHSLDVNENKERQNFYLKTQKIQVDETTDSVVLVPEDHKLCEVMGIEVKQKQNEIDNFKIENHNDLIISLQNRKILDNSCNPVSFFSKNCIILASERKIPNCPYNSDQTNDAILSKGKLERESSIICKSKRNCLNNVSTPINNKIEFVNKATRPIPDLGTKIKENNSCNGKDKNTKSILKTSSRKFNIFKPEKCISNSEEKIRSTKEMFLANLIQLKNNQPKEIIKFIEKNENYVRSLNENLKDNYDNQSSKNSNDQQLENSFSKKFSLKDLKKFINNKKDASEFPKFFESAKATFIRKFLSSNITFENLVFDPKNDAYQKDLNLLQSPENFLKDLMERRNDYLEANSSYLPNEESNKNLETKMKFQAVSSANVIFRSIPTNCKKNPFGKRKKDEYNSKKEDESKTQLNQKETERELKDNNINFEIDILTDANSSEKEENSDRQNEEKINFLGRKHIFNSQQQTKNLRKKGFKYRMFSKEDKKFCLDLLKIFDYNAIANFCNIPMKSLKRWAIIGPERRKGGGRKTRDPAMEAKLIDWIDERKKNAEFFDTKMIKQKALEFTKVDSFMASKGWFNKFQKKYKFALPIQKKQDKNPNK